MERERRYSKEPGNIVCHCECSRYKYCPVDNDSPEVFRSCKAAYKSMLKDMKDKREKK